MTTSDMNAVCSQLLRPEDLTISDELFKKVQSESVITQIVEKLEIQQISRFILLISYIYLQ